jgi:hypothetical protein
MQGLKNTFAFALHDADLKQYIFAFSGDCPMPTREQAMALLRLHGASGQGFAQWQPGNGPSETLTRREIECLRRRLIP